MDSFNHAITFYMESEKSYSTEHIFNWKQNTEEIEFGCQGDCNNGLVSI